MPRKNLIRTSCCPYHIYSRSNNKDWFNLPLREVWDIFLEKLNKATCRHNLDVHCFVLMRNHFHLLVRTPQENIDKAMHQFIHSLSLEIARRSERMNRIFGGRYKWSLVEDEQYLGRVYRYIYQNPLRAGVCKSVEDYPFHSMASST